MRENVVQNTIFGVVLTWFKRMVVPKQDGKPYYPIHFPSNLHYLLTDFNNCGVVSFVIKFFQQSYSCKCFVKGAIYKLLLFKDLEQPPICFNYQIFVFI